MKRVNEDRTAENKLRNNLEVLKINNNKFKETGDKEYKGRIIAYDAPRGIVKRQRVSLRPIEEFLSGKAKFPILGEDPRSPDGPKAFTVHPVMPNGELQGYLYVVLGGEAFDSISGTIGESYILSYGLAIAAVCLLISVIAALAIFNFLTRRLRRLNAAGAGSKS